MKILPTLELALQWAAMAVLALLLWRMRRLGVQRVFPWLWALGFASLVRWLGVMFLPRPSNLYTEYYFATAVFIWGIYFLVIREILGRLLNPWKGLATIAGRFVWVAGAVALSASLWLIWLEAAAQQAAGAPPGQSILLPAFFILNRSVVSTLMILLVLMATFLVWYPLRISRNVTLYWGAFTGLLFSQAVTLAIRNLGRSEWTRPLSLVNGAFELGCWLGMLWWFRPALEDPPVRIGRGGDSDRAEVLIQQLGRINSRIER